MQQVFLYGFHTGVPRHSYAQDFIRDIVKDQFKGKETLQRIVHRLYSSSGIERRHSCVWQDEAGNLDSEFFDLENGTLKTRSTAVRNARYARESRPLFAAAARGALAAAGLEPAQVSHVITVSCTGFYAPGPEYYVVKDLGLPPETERFHIGFMGCFAAFPAWKLAAQICRANPQARVLVICLELCTLHLQFKEDTDNLLSGTVFADGAGACIVAGQQPENLPYATLVGYQGHIAPEGEHDMAWTIGDSGFDMVLSSYIPRIIEANVGPIVRDTLARFGIAGLEDIRNWAVHPGGRAILDKIEKSLALPADALDASREVLRQYGNMSSATIFFVLSELLYARKRSGLTYATAFGPGLTIESAVFDLVPGA